MLKDIATYYAKLLKFDLHFYDVAINNVEMKPEIFNDFLDYNMYLARKYVLPVVNKIEGLADQVIMQCEVVKLAVGQEELTKH